VQQQQQQQQHQEQQQQQQQQQLAAATAAVRAAAGVGPPAHLDGELARRRQAVEGALHRGLLDSFGGQEVADADCGEKRASAAGAQRAQQRASCTGWCPASAAPALTRVEGLVVLHHKPQHLVVGHGCGGPEGVPRTARGKWGAPRVCLWVLFKAAECFCGVDGAGGCAVQFKREPAKLPRVPVTPAVLVE
jgi:hypothetical protein